MPIQNPNVGVAFALVIGAGAATALGASVVFFPSLVKLASRRVLAAALGISAGVMSYVSFTEIFHKSNDGFLEAGHSKENAYLYTTLTLFGGVLIMLVIDFIIRHLSGGHHHGDGRHHHGHGHHHHHDHGNCEGACTDNAGSNAKTEEVSDEPVEVFVPHCVNCADDPIGDLEEWKHRAEDEERRRHDATVAMSHRISMTSNSEDPHQEDDVFDEDGKEVESGNAESAAAASNESSLATPTDDEAADVEAKGQTVDMTHVENKKLVRMGINTALAICIHNFPEGLATFVAALDDPGIGAVLAFAVGMHNIPEGLCVALPIYYATGNRCKAFMWACMSGVSEPIGALLGWAVLANHMTPDVYGVLFGLVAGMMIIIAAKELVPTAHRYDPDDTVVTYGFIGGMAIMALSLVLFTTSGGHSHYHGDHDSGHHDEHDGHDHGEDEQVWYGIYNNGGDVHDEHGDHGHFRY